MSMEDTSYTREIPMQIRLSDVDFFHWQSFLLLYHNCYITMYHSWLNIQVIPHSPIFDWKCGTCVWMGVISPQSHQQWLVRAYRIQWLIDIGLTVLKLLVLVFVFSVVLTSILKRTMDLEIYMIPMHIGVNAFMEQQWSRLVPCTQSSEQTAHRRWKREPATPVPNTPVF